MDLIEIPVEGYKHVSRCHDASSGLNAIISIHNTTYGPALGGMRMWPSMVSVGTLPAGQQRRASRTQEPPTAAALHADHQ